MASTNSQSDRLLKILGSFWAISAAIFFLQTVHCVARLRHASGHRSPYTFLAIGLILSTIYCVVEVFLALDPPSPGANAAVLAIDGLFYVSSISVLYLAIILCLWDRQNALCVTTKGMAGRRHFGHTITHALILSLRVVLAGTDIGLKVPLDSAVMMNATQGAEESLSFYMSAAFLGIMVIDVFFSTFTLRRAMQHAHFSHKFMDMLLYAVAPLYAFNSSAHIIDFVQDTTKNRDRQVTNDIFMLVRCLVNNLTYIYIAALLLSKRNELVDLNALENETSGSETRTSTDKYGHEDTQLPSLSMIPTTIDSYDEKRPFPSFHSTTANLAGIIEEHSRGLSVSEKALLDIVAFFQVQENERRAEKEQLEQKKSSEAFQSKMITDSQVFSALSVVTVFVASLSVSLVSLAQSTYPNNQILIAAAPLPQLTALVAPTATDSTYSCWYMSTFLSLVAGCASGIGAAARNYMAHDHHGAAPAGWMRRDGQIDRALPVVFVFVCLTMAIAVITLIIGLLLFVWDVQTPFVAAATSAPGLAFVLGGALAVGLWVPGRA